MTVIVSLVMVKTMWMVLMVSLNLIMVEEGRNVLQIRGRDFGNWEKIRQEIDVGKRRQYFQEISRTRNKELLRKQKDIKEWIKKVLNDRRNTIGSLKNLGKFSIKLSKIDEPLYKQKKVKDSKFLGDVRKIIKKLHQNQILWTRV